MASLSPKQGMCLAPGCTNRPGPFCEGHAKAPSGKRGGWISAAMRKPYDATVIAPRLWLGGVPPFDRDLPNIDVLVLCARELQPTALAFHGTVLRCPLNDAEPDIAQARTAVQTALEVAKAIASSKRVLVTCHMGLNRSALVVALALNRLTTMSGDEIVDRIRARRGQAALGNQHFVTLIKRIVGNGKAKTPRVLT